LIRKIIIGSSLDAEILYVSLHIYYGKQIEFSRYFIKFQTIYG